MQLSSNSINNNLSIYVATTSDGSVIPETWVSGFFGSADKKWLDSSFLNFLPKILPSYLIPSVIRQSLKNVKV